jgi:hypothetical protein
LCIYPTFSLLIYSIVGYLGWLHILDIINYMGINDDEDISLI